MENAEILKQVTDSMTLLGAPLDLISAVKSWDTDDPNEETLKRIRNWNSSKVDELKDRIVELRNQLYSVSTTMVQLR